MPHTDRPLMKPPPKCTFNEVYEQLRLLSHEKIDVFQTNSGVHFTAEAKCTTDGRLYISLSHNNRIYSCCWGYSANHMGNQGQRIGHYTRALDAWCEKLK